MIIGFSGWAKSGKDTAAAAMGLKRAAFADALKEDMRPILRDLYGFDVLNCTPAEKEIARPWLVGHGAGMRGGDPDYWLKRLCPPAGNPDHWAVTDVRYRNEVKWILDQGGVVVYLVRPDNYPANPEEAESILELLKEFHLHPRFYGVANDSTIESLSAACWALIRRHTHAVNPARDAHQRLLDKTAKSRVSDVWFQRLCDWCGREYDVRTGQDHGRLFCSDACRHASVIASTNNSSSKTRDRAQARRRRASKGKCKGPVTVNPWNAGLSANRGKRR